MVKACRQVGHPSKSAPLFLSHHSDPSPQPAPPLFRGDVLTLKLGGFMLQLLLYQKVLPPPPVVDHPHASIPAASQHPRAIAADDDLCAVAGAGVMVGQF